MYIERVRGDFWGAAVVTMCCWKGVVKISLPGAGGGFGKLPGARKGEEEKEKDTEDSKKGPREVQ